MKKVYIDVSIILKVPFTTVIQRVTKNVVKELLQLIPEKVCLLFYDDEKEQFVILPNENFADFMAEMMNQEELLSTIKKEKGKDISLFSQGDSFLELDAGWGRFTPPRPYLYPRLKDKGVRIFTFVHDVIPVTYPHFCDGDTVIWFLGYLGAVLNYADGIITSTQTVQDEITKIADKLGISRPSGSISWLGSNFKTKAYEEGNIDEELLEKLKDKKFILSVGTVEPIKNHRLLLDAFEQGLYQKDVCLVIVGIGGWNTAQLQNRMRTSPYAGDRFFWLNYVNDDTLYWLYAHAYLVGVSTFEEGFCLPVVEALQHGAPVLAPDIPVSREVGRDYCWYFAANDAHDFLTKVSTLLEVPGEYEQLKAKVEAFAAFTWEDTAKNMVEAIESIPSRQVEEPVICVENETGLSEAYAKAYARCHGVYPVFVISEQEGSLRLELPEYGIFTREEDICLDLVLDLSEGATELQIEYQILGKDELEQYPSGKSHWHAAEISSKGNRCVLRAVKEEFDSRAAILFKVRFQDEEYIARLLVLFVPIMDGFDWQEAQHAFFYTLDRKPNQAEIWHSIYRNHTSKELRCYLEHLAKTENEEG